MRLVNQPSILAGTIGLIFTASIASAEGSNPAVGRAAEQLMFQGSPEKLSIQPRPRFAYLVGDLKSARVVTSDKEQGLSLEVSRENPTVVIEILPYGKECAPPSAHWEDACPIPFPIAPMPPLPNPPPMPFAKQRSKEPGRTDDLSTRWTDDDKISLTATGQAPFWVVAEGRIQSLLPGMRLTVAPPVEVFRLLAVGSFAPELELAGKATDFVLMPCPGPSWDGGLCTPEQARANIDRSP